MGRLLFIWQCLCATKLDCGVSVKLGYVRGVRARNLSTIVDSWINSKNFWIETQNSWINDRNFWIESKNFWIERAVYPPKYTNMTSFGFRNYPISYEIKHPMNNQSKINKNKNLLYRRKRGKSCE